MRLLDFIFLNKFFLIKINKLIIKIKRYIFNKTILIYIFNRLKDKFPLNLNTILFLTNYCK